MFFVLCLFVLSAICPNTVTPESVKRAVMEIFMFDLLAANVPWLCEGLEKCSVVYLATKASIS